MPVEHSYNTYDMETILPEKHIGNLRAVNVHDLITGQTGQWCINIRGTNGSGKTSLAQRFVDDPMSKIFLVSGLNKTAFTYSPRLNVLVVGGYKLGKCGGCDTLVKEQIIKLIQLAWMTSANIIFEGIIVSDSKEPYYYFLKELSKTLSPRIWGFVYLKTSFEECLRRIYKRNNNKPINEKLVVQKYKNAIRYEQWHKEQGDCVVMSINTERPQWDVFLEFLTAIEEMKQGAKHISK